MRRSRIACVALLLALVAACSRPPAFEGAALDPPRATLDFSLTDQFGQRVRLSALHGKVVVLTFLYTSCTDTCELTTQQIRRTATLLGARAGGVAFLAVSVDPARDTVAQLARYSRKWGMLERWRFLTGTEAELRPLWRYYWVGDAGREPGRGASYEVRHAVAVHLIDRGGRVRVAYGAGFAADALAHDILELLARG